MSANYDMIEHSAWVDKLLEEKYYGYGRNSDNIDDYINAELLVENYAWVDDRLAEMCRPVPPMPLRPCFISWLGNRREWAELEDYDNPILGKRKRDISNQVLYITQQYEGVETSRNKIVEDTMMYNFVNSDDSDIEIVPSLSRMVLDDYDAMDCEDYDGISVECHSSDSMTIDELYV